MQIQAQASPIQAQSVTVTNTKISANHSSIKATKATKQQLDFLDIQSASSSGLSEKRISIISSQDHETMRENSLLDKQRVIKILQNNYSLLIEKNKFKESSNFSRQLFGNTFDKKGSSWMKIIKKIIKEIPNENKINMTDLSQAARLITITVQFYMKVNNYSAGEKNSTYPILIVLKKMVKQFFQTHGFNNTKQLANLRECYKLTGYRLTLENSSKMKTKTICFSGLGDHFASNQFAIPHFITQIKSAGDKSQVEKIINQSLTDTTYNTSVEPNTPRTSIVELTHHSRIGETIPLHSIRALSSVTQCCFMSPGILNAIYFHDTLDIDDITNLEISNEHKHVLLCFNAIKQAFYSQELTENTLRKFIYRCSKLQDANNMENYFFPTKQWTARNEKSGRIDYNNLSPNNFSQFMQNLITILTPENEREKNHVIYRSSDNVSGVPSQEDCSITSYQTSAITLAISESATGWENSNLQAILKSTLGQESNHERSTNTQFLINPEKFELFTVVFQYDHNDVNFIHDDIGGALMRDSCNEINLTFGDISGESIVPLTLEKISTSFLVPDSHTVTSIKDGSGWLLIDKEKVDHSTSDENFDLGTPVSMTFRVKSRPLITFSNW